MKTKITERMLSGFLSLLMVLSLFTYLSTSSESKVHAATASQLNIVDRANYMYNSTWVCQKDVNGWRDQTTFTKGNTYHLPYGQPVYAGQYVGFDAFGASEDTYQAAAADASSVFYTSRSNYAGKYSTYYATDCSAFISYCWGIARQTTATIPNVSTKIGTATESNIRNYLQLGDALNSNSAGHVVIVTGITYDSSGTMTAVEITEQTPPQLKKSSYSPSSLASKYASSYTIYRYTGAVGSAPASGSLYAVKQYIFDVEFYNERYPDVAAIYGSNSYQHFFEYGIKEGRIGSPYFSINWYREKNADIKEAFGDDNMAAMNHFAIYASKEKDRKLSPIIDCQFYSEDTNSDLANMSATEKLDHFLAFGMNEGRSASEEFDPYAYALCYRSVYKNKGIAGCYRDYMMNCVQDNNTCSVYPKKIRKFIYNNDFYAGKYPDLVTALGSSDFSVLMDHFLIYGVKEDRIASPYFSTAWYREKNADISSNSEITNRQDAINYFMQNAKSQKGHTLSPIIDCGYYAENNEAVSEMTDFEMLDYFVNTGVKNGDTASAEFDPYLYAMSHRNSFVKYGITDTYTDYVRDEVEQDFSNKTYPAKLREVVFNADFYGAKYSDAKEVCGNDEKALIEHFMEIGLAGEDMRTASPYFSASWYLKNNEEVADYAGESYFKSIRHFIFNADTTADSKLSPIFDCGYYETRYPETKDYTVYEKVKDFMSEGVKKGRWGSESFDPVSYACFNTDAFVDFGLSNCYTHYMVYGDNSEYGQYAKAKSDIGTDFYGIIVDENSGKRLDSVERVAESRYDDGNSVQINSVSGEDNQLWYFERQSDGTYKIKNVGTGLLLDVYNSAINGGNIGVAQDLDSKGQRWIVYNQNGNCVFRAECSDDVMSVAESAKENYSEVLCSVYSGAKSQQFRIIRTTEDGLVPGDINYNGDISICDVTYIQMVLSRIKDGTVNDMIADVDGDGELTILDATIIQKYLSKHIENFPCQE